jgi:hypothetical protein
MPFDRRGRSETDIADEVIEVGIGCRNVAGLKAPGIGTSKAATNIAP